MKVTQLEGKMVPDDTRGWNFKSRVYVRGLVWKGGKSLFSELARMTVIEVRCRCAVR